MFIDNKYSWLMVTAHAVDTATDLKTFEKMIN